MEDPVFNPNMVRIKEEPQSPKQQLPQQVSPQAAIKQESDSLKRKRSVDSEKSNDDDNDSDEESLGELTEGPKILSHKSALDAFQDGLMELILRDPLLNDLPTAITLEEVNSLISLEHGGAIIVNVRRADDTVLPVVVVQNGTVLDLKKAIKGHIQRKMFREDGPLHLSWRYIWKSYWLYFQGQKLSDDNKKIKDYGIQNRDEVIFIRRLREK